MCVSVCGVCVCGVCVVCVCVRVCVCVCVCVCAVDVGFSNRAQSEVYSFKDREAAVSGPLIGEPSPWGLIAIHVNPGRGSGCIPRYILTQPYKCLLFIYLSIHVYMYKTIHSIFNQSLNGCATVCLEKLVTS